MEKRYLTVIESSQFTGVSRWTIYRDIDDQKITVVRVRGCVRIDKEDLISYMRNHKVYAIGQKK